ncbi:aldo/keto reductase [Streptomyces sp. NE06-03E]|uniref:aldo/keto reductase n=1 Tax=unclassified Streptomyces TaxID=2593676 RepID=UPI0029BA517B|nr:MULTISPECIES: aldo/keto reductase [unclassified Streptomyces]MDX3056160.1 aldo/keto reductase [Streptomyces sp. NE06-03E]WSS72362.1 aldo/keto reductase [Streptomyces sp. NBC_01175]WSS79397.1 aldo/keto reductase [Streptomyces sp. NBC_01174]
MASPTRSLQHTASGAPRAGGPGRLAGRTVSRVGFGAMQLERLRGDRKAAVALLRRSVELGIDHIDTAQFYGHGFVNDVIREAIRPEDDVIVVSKVGADPEPDGPVPLRFAQRPEQLRASVEDNLAALGLEQIPLVNLRRPDSGPGLRAEGDQIVALDDQLAVMTALRDEGKIGAIGLSSVTADGVRRALPAGIACVQNAYSLLTRDDEDTLRLCLAEDIAWVPYFPLGSAFEGLPKVSEEPAVIAAARDLAATPAQVGLAWLLHHAPHLLLIPGTADPGHLKENVDAGALTLDEATLAALDAVPPRSGDIALG